MDKKKSKRFEDALLQYSQETDVDERKKIEQSLWLEFGSEHAIMVLDMSGFSLFTRRYGIIHYLSMVRRMQLTAKAIVESLGGSVIKFEADNCFAIFDNSLTAIRAAIAMQLAFDAVNIITPKDFDIHIAIGIDYGKILIIGNDDYFGDPVNSASKLGEDIAAAGEILVTQEAMRNIPADSEIRSRPLELNISGLTIAAYAIKYRDP